MKIIKITKEDKFIWKVVTPQQARIIYSIQLFSLYELRDDDSESLIKTALELENVIKRQNQIGIEVGLYNKKNHGKL